MKAIAITLGLIVISSTAFAQQSMILAHTGANPAVLNVAVGEEITFIHGGGGSHPMTENWGDGTVSTPEPFVTQTVTSANPQTTFTQEVEGVYVFHCGTNPNNSNLWGKIIVGEPDGVEEAAALALTVFPNPASDVLNVEGNRGDAVIMDFSGKIVKKNFGLTVIISDLEAGTYIVSQRGVHTTFVKH